VKLRLAGLSPSAVILTLLLTILLFLAGCGHPKQEHVNVPPPPAAAPVASPPERSATSNPESSPKKDRPSSTESRGEASSVAPAEPAVPLGARPLATEVGRASWYGPPYHNRRGSNGEVYNMNAMTAAHRTLPFGTMVRVTNLRNRRTVVVRINDRGPFVKSRVIDVSQAAAKQLQFSGLVPI